MEAGCCLWKDHRLLYCARNSFLTPVLPWLCLYVSSLINCTPSVYYIAYWVGVTVHYGFVSMLDRTSVNIHHPVMPWNIYPSSEEFTQYRRLLHTWATHITKCIIFVSLHVPTNLMTLRLQSQGVGLFPVTISVETSQMKALPIINNYSISKCNNAIKNVIQQWLYKQTFFKHQKYEEEATRAM